LLWPSYGQDRKYQYTFLVNQALCFILVHADLFCSGGVPPYIYGELGGADRWVWFVLANLLALAAVCPFVGALSDLIGRRYVAMSGASLVILGMIVASTAHNMNIFIGRHFGLEKMLLS